MKFNKAVNADIINLSNYLVENFSSDMSLSVEKSESAVEMTVRLLSRLKFIEEKLGEIGYKIKKI